MRIVVDIQGAQTESRKRGIGRYSTALLDAMIRNAGDHEIIVALNGANQEGVPEIVNELKNVLPEERIKFFYPLSNIAWHSDGVAWRRNSSELLREYFLAGLQPDVVHVSSLFEGATGDAVSSIARRERSLFTAVTHYDLIPYLNQEAYLVSDWARDWYMDKVASLKKADLLLAISEYSKRELVGALGVDCEKVVNISSAISNVFKPAVLDEELHSYLKFKFGLEGRYLMYSGAMEPRKNAERLLRAFAKVKFGGLSDVKLVIAGKIERRDLQSFRNLISDLRIAEDVILTGFVSDEDLIKLYSACSVYVFPSLHEGFGLPALEAMACGAPTIGSSTTSIPEVIGNAKALFDPSNIEEIADLVRKVLIDKAFANSLRMHARCQSSKFSWDVSAKTALAAFENHGKKTWRRPLKLWVEKRAFLEENYTSLIRELATADGVASANEGDLIDAAASLGKIYEENETSARCTALPDKLKWRIEGPFDSTYSLAVVNRSLALALSQLGHDVALHSTEGPGDFVPSSVFLRENQEISEIYGNCRCILPENADVTTRLLYPPRVKDMKSQINALHVYAWEESGFPQAWMDDFNNHLQGISCISHHVRDIMINSGVSIPVTVSYAGVDHWLSVSKDRAYEVRGKKYKFLHVSSCFPRKGVDVLLRAYGEVFTIDDDVSIIIKTFNNPHNDVNYWLEYFRQSNSRFPDVIVIEEDLRDGQLAALYSMCDALVAPSRAEGFGLPLAEAMLMGLPVICTAWGGHLDFCNENTAWLVDFNFAKAQSHLQVSDSVWAEPDIGSLAFVMKKVRDAAPSVLEEKCSNAKKLLLSDFKWIDVAKRVENDVRQFSMPRPPRSTPLAWISTWNTKCGIAMYSSHLARHYSDEQLLIFAADDVDAVAIDRPNVIRCWSRGEGDSLSRLADQVNRSTAKALIIQFQYSFFDFNALFLFINGQKSLGRVIIIEMHSTVDDEGNPRKKLEFLADALAVCDRVLVHNVEDLNRLKRIGVWKNTALFPLGINFSRQESVPQTGGELCIATYGFALPHKGILEFLRALKMLREKGVSVTARLVNAEFPDPVSAVEIKKIKNLISSLGLSSSVSMITEFLTDEESMATLRRADLVVFPYQKTGESSSGAVRFGIASGKPVLVTPLSIFDDVDAAVHRLPGTDPGSIAKGLEEIIVAIKNNDQRILLKNAAASKWIEEHDFGRMAVRLKNMACHFSGRE